MPKSLKTETIKIRTTPEEREKLNALAKEQNLNLSQLILTQTLNKTESNPLLSKTTHDFLLHLEKLRYNTRKLTDDAYTKEILTLIDEEVAYLWLLSSTSQNNI